MLTDDLDRLVEELRARVLRLTERVPQREAARLLGLSSSRAVWAAARRPDLGNATVRTLRTIARGLDRLESGP